MQLIKMYSYLKEGVWLHVANSYMKESM